MYSFSDIDNQTVVVNEFRTANWNKVDETLAKADKPVAKAPCVGFAMFKESPTLTDIF
jgi:hypothetical protein